MREKAEWICLEQSVELPDEVLDSKIRQDIVGKIRDVAQIQEQIWKVEIQFPIDNVGTEVSQFLNVLYGNISLVDGIKVVDLEWEKLTEIFPGPAFGISGVREQIGEKNRPLSCTALKPMGFSPGKLGRLCFEFARGGLDIIKDDHGLANQSYAEFEDRVKACVLAVKRAFEETGNRARYYPNITADGGSIERYRRAYEMGADGVLFSPHLVGLDQLALLRKDPTPLPIMAHPSFSGSLVVSRSHGFSHDFLYGSLWRALGADFVIYPNVGGRFNFTAEQCEAINTAARTSDSPFKPCFPTPGGGVEAAQVHEWKKRYGVDTVFLIGGSLYKNEAGVFTAAKEFRQALES